MGLSRNYLRYVHEATLGVVAASGVGAAIKFLNLYDTKDRYVATPANESIHIWDLKTKQLIRKLFYDSDNATEVTTFDCYHGGRAGYNLLAVGHANGSVRVFDYDTGTLKTTFTGHRSSIACLVFDKDGSRLASGGKDCNIILWDIVADRGLFSLKGHKNSITKIAFLKNSLNQRDLLISSSVDSVSTIKFWDLQVQHCFWTIPGQSSGIWSFVVVKGGTRLISGSSDPELKVWSINFIDKQQLIDSSQHNGDSAHDAMCDPGVEGPELEYGVQIERMGSILRNSDSVSKRVQDIQLDLEESIMACHAIDKYIEFYGIRDDEETLNFAKKKIKKENRKRMKRNVEGVEVQNEDSTADLTVETISGQTLLDSEINRKYSIVRVGGKVKSLAVVKCKKDKKHYKVACMMADNKIEYFIYKPTEETPIEHLGSIDHQSHRSDVRSIAISNDGQLIMSASRESVKVWRQITGSCIATVPTEYATCCTFASLKSEFGDKYAFLATKTGNIQIIDVAAAEVIETINVCENEKPLSCIYPIPDGSGLISGGENNKVTFWSFDWIQAENGKAQILTLRESRSLPFQEAILCVRISANCKFLAVALLDSTVKIYFMDSFKFFLSLYGHKFPVLTMDISDDNTIIATGSADKNIKIWGMDFGDCHKSIFAHDEAITCLKFMPKTHYLFSCGQDRAVKQWDCDHFMKIQTLRKHQAEIWCLDVSSSGKEVVTGSHDKSIRIFSKTEEMLIPEEEDVAEREAQDERNVFENQDNIIPGEVSLETGFASKMTIETVKSTDRLMEAIDVFSSEQDKQIMYDKACQSAKEKGEDEPPRYEIDPLVISANTQDYNRFMLEILRKIRSSDLEEILLTLPFEYVRKLLIILVIFLDRRWDVELMVRCACFLLRVNFGQIMACPALVPVINKMRSIIAERTIELKDIAGVNMIALDNLSFSNDFKL